MRRPIIAGNWKLHKKTVEALELAREIVRLTEDCTDTEIIVAPSFTVLGKVSEALSGSRISVAGQDCFWQEEGAFTGEVSPGMLLDAGCTHVIIGHSERRQHFGDTDATVNRKTKAALLSGLSVIVCIGETLQEREAGETLSVIERQVRGGLQDICARDIRKIVIAYEPVWAIGTGKTATDVQAQEVHSFIRTIVSRLYSPTDSDTVRILYGGSVKPDNIRGLMSCPDIDGALVGGASLSATSFSSIIRNSK
ncbi:MAG: triose-phosphate isomerase [Geobacteraceae bacterium]|nr:triose-phosphate isomerase [Geobacteraceae bacterium]